MTVVLWILGAVLLIVLLLSRLWLGVQVRGNSGDWQVWAWIGPLRFQLYPTKEPKKTQEPETKAKEDSGAKKEKMAFPKVTPELLRSAYREIWPPLRRALDRLRRAVRVDPLDVSVTIGGADDPPESAELYGVAQGALWTGMPVLERLLDIPDPHIHIGIDFDTPQPDLRLSLGVQARLGALVVIALNAGMPAIRWYQNTLRREAPAAEKSAAA